MVEAVLAFVVMGVLVAVVAVLRARRARPRRRVSAEAVAHTLNLTEQDARDLVEVGRRLEAEFTVTPSLLVLHRLRSLDNRKVPLRGVKPGAAHGLGRLCFADGTVIQVRGRHDGDLGTLSARAMRSRVWLDGYHQEPLGVVVDIGWTHGGVSVLAVGLDQED